MSDAAGKFAVKRKKKHMFNDAGVPMEPFNLENDIKDGFLTREGVFKMEREKRQAESDEEQDAWFESIREQQAKMQLEKSHRQQDSDATESEDEDLGSKEDPDEVVESGEEGKTDKLTLLEEINKLKKEMITLLD